MPSPWPPVVFSRARGSLGPVIGFLVVVALVLVPLAPWRRASATTTVGGPSAQVVAVQLGQVSALTLGPPVLVAAALLNLVVGGATGAVAAALVVGLGAGVIARASQRRRRGT